MKIRILAVIELDVHATDDLGLAKVAATRQLDAFRESVQPGAEHGICIYKANVRDLADFAHHSSGDSSTRLAFHGHGPYYVVGEE